MMTVPTPRSPSVRRRRDHGGLPLISSSRGPDAARAAGWSGPTVTPSSVASPTSRSSGTRSSCGSGCRATGVSMTAAIARCSATTAAGWPAPGRRRPGAALASSCVASRSTRQVSAMTPGGGGELVAGGVTGHGEAAAVGVDVGVGQAWCRGQAPLPDGRVREPGGGRKSVEQNDPGAGDGGDFCGERPAAAGHRHEPGGRKWERGRIVDLVLPLHFPIVLMVL
jgi:hypothetical protein